MPHSETLWWSVLIKSKFRLFPGPNCIFISFVNVLCMSNSISLGSLHLSSVVKISVMRTPVVNTAYKSRMFLIHWEKDLLDVNTFICEHPFQVPFVPEKKPKMLTLMLLVANFTSTK